MYKKILVLVLILFLIVPVFVQSKTNNDVPQVKVGVVEDSKEIKVEVPSNYMMVNEYSGNSIKCRDGDLVKDGEFILQPLSIGIKITHYLDGTLIDVFTGPIRITEDYETDSKARVDGIRYRGDIVISTQYKEDENGDSQDTLLAVNHIDIQSYLRGVVPKEMPAFWHVEALKAQAVTARTYTLKSMGKHGQEYDLCSTQHCQVYGGYDAEQSSTDHAVEATSGKVLTYNNSLAHTFYHAANGGHTEAPENVWTNALPYLKSTPDPYDNPYEGYLKPRADWGPVSFTADNIISRLKYRDIDVGELVDVVIRERASSGRVIDLEFVGTGDSYNALREKARTIFSYNCEKEEESYPSLNSQMFDLKTDSQVWVQTSSEKSEVSRLENAFVATASGFEQLDISKISLKSGYEGKDRIIPFRPTSFVFNGQGWGHGIGMSQSGAYNRAKDGQTYDEIMSFYYSGTELKQWYK